MPVVAEDRHRRWDAIFQRYGRAMDASELREGDNKFDKEREERELAEVYLLDPLWRARPRKRAPGR